MKKPRYLKPRNENNSEKYTQYERNRVKEDFLRQAIGNLMHAVKIGYLAR